MPAARTLGHVPALDGVRAVAVTVVVVHHLGVLAPSVSDHFRGGFLGVDVFFVLSGFLITALLLKEIDAEGHVRFGGFFARRAARLLPAITVLLAAHLVYAAVIDIPTRVEWLNIRSIALYYYNWDFVWNFRSVEGLGHLWSLSVEEQFYLVWPFAVVGLAVLLRRHPLLPVAVLGAATVAVALWRIHLLDVGEFKLSLYVRTDTRADALLIGALLAFLWTRGRMPTGRWMPLAGAIASAFLLWAFVFVDLQGDFLFRGGFTLVALATAVVMGMVLADPGSAATEPLRAAPVRTVGRVSYGIYLWHLPVFVAVNRGVGELHPLARVIVALAATGAIVAGSWIVVERPVLDWSSRRRAARTAATDQVSPTASA